MNKLTYINISRFIFFLFLFLLLVFGRNFTGIYIFNFRIGELIVGLQVLLTHYFVFRISDKKLKKLYIAFLMLFYLKLYYVIFDLEDFNLFRFSSILWATSMFAVGFEFKFNKKTYLNILIISLFSLYTINYIYYPNILIKFFNTYSDKFDFTKPSFLLLVFCLTNFFAFKIYKFYNFFTLLIISSVLYIPIFLNQSRGTLISVLTLVLIIFLNFLSMLIKVKFKPKIYLALTFLVILSSVFYLLINLQETTFSNSFIESNNFSFELEKVNDNNSTFYIDRGLLTSRDENINWRLTIWQTTLYDMFNEKLLLFGYPIHKQLPIMQHPYYKTIFLENYNVHNFLIQFFAYFGFAGVTILILLFSNTISKYYKSYNSLDILFLVIPILVVSSFDSSMESVGFPFIFYYSLGLLINSKES